MPKQLIVNMQQLYPFGQCDEADGISTKVLVRRVIETNEEDRNWKQSQTSFFRKLNHHCIIKLESILEEEGSLHLLYQYVPIKLSSWISNINQKFIENFCKQFFDLGEYLSKCYIITDFTLQNIGMDQNYKAKYFLDLDFEINQKVSKFQLKEHYREQALKIFQPYLQAKRITKNIGNNQGGNERIIEKYNPENGKKSDRSDAFSIGSAGDMKAKMMVAYKQRKNESISVCSNYELMIPNSHENLQPERNRKQSILSSVSNIKIGRMGKRIDQIKNKLRNMNSPDPIVFRTQQKSIQKNNNILAFNYGTTEKIIGNFSSKETQKINAQIYQNIFKKFNSEENIFNKFEDVSRRAIQNVPLKKNQSLKEKQYGQMINSGDGYFQDFFQVLEDKPEEKKIKINGSIKAIMPMRSNGEYLSPNKIVHQHKKEHQANNMQELQDRVKFAINKSKNLINKFKVSDQK